MPCITNMDAQGEENVAACSDFFSLRPGALPSDALFTCPLMPETAEFHTSPTT